MGDRAHEGTRIWTKPLRFHLSVIVAALLVGIASVLIVLNHIEGRQAALAFATQEMKINSDRILDRYRAVFGGAALLVEVASGSRMVRRPEKEDQAALGRFLQQVLRNSEYIDSAYVGYPTGAFVDAVSLTNDPQWRTALSAPANATLATRIIALNEEGQHLSSWEFLDSDGHWLATTEAQATDYDPRERPWYRSAAQTTKLIVTAPYRFATTKALGITLAQRDSVYGSLVVGVDVLVGTLNAFLSTQLITANSKVYIFDAHNQLIASSDQDSSIKGQCGETCTLAQREDNSLRDYVSAAVAGPEGKENGPVTLSVGGHEYLAVVSLISATPLIEGGHIVSLAPVKDLTAASDRLLQQGLLISAGVLVVGVACVFLMARQISRSLAALTSQAHQLMRFELGPSERITSRITEIWHLGGAVRAARETISAFGLYVPTDLVRRIIRSREFTDRSAHKQCVTALFSDIEDFAAICEQYPAEQVVSLLSDYFDLFSEVVKRHRGVIIQFSGDSVFALWNAPEEDEWHIDNGCLCALELAARVKDFNSDQSQRGAAELATRLGIHTGHVVVGSVGAKDRFQYTAMGDAVNVASRLEGLNKEFKTTILVSGAVVAGAKSDFGFRPLGCVRVKGREEEVEVFELPSRSGPDGDRRSGPLRAHSTASDPSGRVAREQSSGSGRSDQVDAY
jgi:adenylate cyclase